MPVSMGGLKSYIKKQGGKGGGGDKKPAMNPKAAAPPVKNAGQKTCTACGGTGTVGGGISKTKSMSALGEGQSDSEEL